VAIAVRGFSWAEGLIGILALVSFLLVFLRLFELLRVKWISFSV
jgi:hypothetical protein